MEKYDIILKNNQILRNALWEVYGKKCVYCGRMIDVNHLQIDHIIPINNRKIEDNIEYDSYIKQLEDNGFIKDCIINYLPSCISCNNTKRDNIYSVASLIYYHELTNRKTSKIIEYINKKKGKIEKRKKEMEASSETDKALSKPRDFNKPKKITPSSEFKRYSYALKRVRIDAFLPCNLKENLSCLIEFNQKGVSNCSFSYNEEELFYIFFCDCQEELYEKQIFTKELKEGEVWINLPYTRFKSDIEVAEELSYLIQDLFQEYNQNKEELINKVGGRLFEELENTKGEFNMISIPVSVWNSIVSFSKFHKYYKDYFEWNIFDMKNEKLIYINKNSNDQSISADTFVILKSERISEENINIIWSKGFHYNLNEMEGFNNIQKWTVDYTHDWILEELIPKVHYENLDWVEKKFKHNDFEKFKNSFDYKKYGIKSLKFGSED